MYMVVVPGPMLLGFRADLVYAEATAAFAKSPREGVDLFRNFLSRIARPSFRTQAPHFFPSLQADVVTVPQGDSTTHVAKYFSFPLVTVTAGVSDFTTVRTWLLRFFVGVFS